MAKRDFKGASISYQFAAIPMEVLRSPEWVALPPSAAKLAMALVGQYTGKNNGRLCPSVEALQGAGYTMTKPTVIAATRALLECEWCFLTRQGRPPRTTTWIGFTWWKLDWLKDMDIQPREFPHLNFAKPKMADPNHGRGPPPKLISEVKKFDLDPSKQALRGKETLPIEAL